MTKGFYIRFFFYLLIIGIFFMSIFYKIDVITKNNKRDVPTFVGEWNKNGKPVYVKNLVPENIDVIEKITGNTTDGVNMTCFVNLEIKSILKNDSNIFIKVENGNEGNEKTKKINAKIVSISNNIDYKTGMYIIKLKLDTKIPKDLVKNFYTCYIVKNRLKNVVILKNEAIKEEENNKHFVFLLNEKNTVCKQYITLGYNDGFNQVITKGLKFGDRVVIEGMSILKENDKVNIVKIF